MDSIEINSNTAPLNIFIAWLKDAAAIPNIRESTAMTLSTQGSTGEIHSRVVLCRQWSNEGFTFFTNYESRKGLDLLNNNRATALFFWDALARQIEITGTVQRTPRETSEKYWNARARDSQISQYVSHQSQPVASREEMEHSWNEANEKFKDKLIPCPDNWGGYTLTPKRLEFWIGRAGRFHDRYVFEKSQARWTFCRLYP